MASPVTSATVQTFQAKFYIDKRDVGMVIGGKGKTINGIKRTHGVDVRIMDSDRADGKQFFLITGSDRSAVDAAYKNVDQIAANSERKRQTGTSQSGPRRYGSVPSHDTSTHAVQPPGYTVFINGFNYIIPQGMMLVPAQMVPGPSTPQGGYGSVPATPQKPKGGRKVVKRKKNPGPINTGDFAPTVRQPRPVPVMPASTSYNPTSPTYTPSNAAFVPKSPDYSPPSPDYMPHTPDGPPPPKTPPADGRIADWSAEDKTEGSGGDAQ